LVSIKVLDPACGSGNFLNIALLQLLDFQKEAVISGRIAFGDLPLIALPR
jgi:type I restriction-modification system DNA methylase subunit